MKIAIEKLAIKNFKGLSELEIKFDEKTEISGKNESGKTTIQDAFTWLLFGKDSSGSANIDIKFLDQENNPVSRQDHSVEGVLRVDGQKVTAKRIFREKWITKKGSSEPEFSGNETVFYWNDVPVSQSEYKLKVESVCDESLFKIITSTRAFNEMPWKEQRGILEKIVDGVSDLDIAESNDAFRVLFDSLQNKSLDEFKRELAAKRKKLKDELKQFGPRIDEVKRGIQEPVDSEKITKDIEAIEKGLSEINKKASDQSKVHESILTKRREKNEEIDNLKRDRLSVYSTANEIFKSNNDKISLSVRELTDKKESLSRSLSVIENERSELHKSIESKSTEAESLRNQFSGISKQEFIIDESSVVCQTCKRKVDDYENEVSKMRENFNVNKQKTLEEINQKGADLMELVNKERKSDEELFEKITTLKEGIKNLKKEIEKASSEKVVSMTLPKEHGELSITIEKAEKELSEITEGDKEDFDSQRRPLIEKRDQLKQSLAVNDQIERSKKRVLELEKEEKELAQKLADTEKQEFACEEFTKCKNNLIESKINAKFKYVKFKLFNVLINGGYEPTCTSMVNGVPFRSINNAAKINAGIDIINTLSMHYDISAPIFVDNAESVNDLLPTNSQIIKLTVSTEPLKIS